MVKWRDFVGRRAAMWLVGAIAVLSVLVGIANISATLGGPLATVVPDAVARTAGFTGTLTGFLLLLSAYGLRRRLKSAWYLAALLLPLAAVQGLLQSSTFSYPLVVLSLVALPIVVLNRRGFTREIDFTLTQWAAAAALVGSLAYSAAGAYALREQFNNVDTLIDAVYFSIVTASTVGYGDVTPVTGLAKLFTISALVLNVASFAVALGVLFTPAIEARLSNALGRMTDTNLELLDQHVLVLGHGDLTESLIEELTAADTPFLLVTPEESVAQTVREHGVDVLVADSADESALERAGVEKAQAVVAATNDDARDALAILTARQLNPAVTIVAAATNTENETKLKRAGADTVVSPARIGGHLLVESALEMGDSEAIARELLDDRGSFDTSGDGVTGQ